MKEKKELHKYNIVKVLVKVIWGALLTAYGIACTYLYYMQSNHKGELYFESDLPYHIDMALDGWGYSVTAIIYRLLDLFPMRNMLIAIFLSLCTVGTILITYYVLRPYINNEICRIAVATICGIVMPFFIREIHYQRYIGYQSASIWHNSTYIVLKLVAIITLFLCFDIARKYSEKLDWKKCVLFAVLLALTTAVKTSFVVVFAPAALCILVADGFAGVPVKRLFAVATTVVPTILVVLFQEAVLFGEDTGNGIVIEFGYTVFSRADKPQYTMILSALFPVIIFLFNIIPVVKDTWKDFKVKKKGLTHREFLLGWTMWFFGAAELLFLKETGAREKDANFAWGYSFCLFILFMMSCIYFVRNLQNKDFLGGSKAAKVIYGIVMCGILGYHVYCGIYFFMCLLEGTTYFM